MNHKRYSYLPDFFKKKFGERVQKVSIDGGFTCPNRDGTVGNGGCVFCNNESFVPGYCREIEGIASQVEEGIRFFSHKYQGQKYLAYFQSYSNTYAPLDVLKVRYEEALAHPQVVGLVIGTRPDTVSEEILDYLEHLAESYYVCIEYGVESVDDNVLKYINRGHCFEDAERAIIASAGRGIAVGAHLIFGLPGESRKSMLEGAVRLSELPIEILKFHQLQIIKDTRLADIYNENPESIRLYTANEYLDFIVEVIETIRPEIYLERFLNHAPDEYLVAPKWGMKNYEFMNLLDKTLKERDTWQGKRRV